MSCNCMEKFTAGILERQPFKDLKVIEAEFDKAMIFSNDSLIARPIIEIELTCEGRKHPVRKSIIYNYYPLCGQRFEPLEKEEEAQS